MPTQVLLGCIPVLHHNNPKDVFVIGLGSGITAKSVLDFSGVDSVTCAEIEPAVIEANRFFSSYNGNLLENPRCRIQVNDGRNALLASSHSYDLIISEPSNPWIAGVSNLFTKEFYEIGRRRLNSKGLFCQWFHLYSMHASDVKMILNTFFSVFPHGSLWLINEADIILLGSEEEPVLDYKKLSAAFHENAQFKKNMASIGIDHPDAILAARLAGSEDIKALFRTALLNSDNMPILEFSAPRSLYMDSVPTNIEGLFEYRASGLEWVKAIPEGHIMAPSYYQVLLGISPYKELERLYGMAVSMHPREPSIYIATSRRYLETGKLYKAEAELHKIKSFNLKDARTDLMLGNIYRTQGIMERARESYLRGYRLDPSNEQLVSELLETLINLKQYDRALTIAKAACRRDPGNSRYGVFRGMVLVTNEKIRSGHFCLGSFKGKPP